MKLTVVLLMLLFCSSSNATNPEDCRAKLLTWWLSSSWPNKLTNEIAPYITKILIEKNLNNSPLTLSEKVAFIGSVHKEYLENSIAHLPNDAKAEFLKSHNEPMPSYIRIMLIKAVFPEITENEFYELAGFSPPTWKYQFKDIIPYITAVAREKTASNKSLTIFEKIAIVDLGHKRYIEKYSSQLSGNAKTSFLNSHDKKLTIFTRIHLLELAFPETSQEDLDRLQKVAVGRTKAYIKDLD